MLTVRKAQDRGHAEHGWLSSRHTFSFADYYDDAQMGFGPLRVINEDRVQPGKGFGTHGHRDMEIISYVLEGSLAHKDSAGNSGIIKPGDVQKMSAGTGVMHSEANASSDAVVHFLQIWLLPEFTGGQPSYQQQFFRPEEKQGRLRLVASKDGREGSLLINQDAFVYATVLRGGDLVRHEIAAGRRGYLHVARGRVVLNGTELAAGDGVRIVDETGLELRGVDSGEALMFDLP